MKCIKNKDEMRRVRDDEAIEMVKKGWQYCKKSEYKARNGKKTETKKAVKEVKVERKSDLDQALDTNKKEVKGRSKYREKHGAEKQE